MINMGKMDFSNTKFGIYMLPVGEGDCFYIQLPCNENTVFRIMIDSGPVASWNKVLKPFFEDLERCQLHIDLLIVTHIDADHIGGALRLFKDEHLRTLVNEVWFNDLRHIVPISSNVKTTAYSKSVYSQLASSYHVNLTHPNESISAHQAHMLAELLEQTGTIWNNGSGSPICAGMPCYTIAPEIYIDILLPTKDALNNLYTYFSSQVNSICMGTKVIAMPESERAFELSLYCNQESNFRSQSIAGTIENLGEIAKWADKSPIPDNSVTNASSIVICIRYFGKTVLFPGDATSNDLIVALQTWCNEVGHPLWFDIIKLPHHGSARNCLNLLDYIDGTYFLISTDGKKFSHPDKETLAKIVSRPVKPCTRRKLLFNYRNNKYILFSEKASEEKYQYKALICDGFITFFDQEKHNGR